MSLSRGAVSRTCVDAVTRPTMTTVIWQRRIPISCARQKDRKKEKEEKVRMIFILRLNWGNFLYPRTTVCWIRINTFIFLVTDDCTQSYESCRVARISRHAWTYFLFILFHFVRIITIDIEPIHFFFESFLPLIASAND